METPLIHASLEDISATNTYTLLYTFEHLVISDLAINRLQLLSMNTTQGYKHHRFIL